jgi:hypothetical protein
MVCVSGDSLFQDSIAIPVAIDSSIDVTAYVTGAESCYWRVRAYNPAGWGPWSEAWEFYINITDIDDTDHLVPDNYHLFQNYPNPFNGSTTFRFTLTEPCIVTIKIYDLLGRELEALVDADYQSGEHTITWDAEMMPSGIYFARMVTSSKSSNIRMTLLK